jgi:hypothetical protein
VVVVCQIQQTYNQSISISRVFCLAQPWRAPRALRQGRRQTSQPKGNPRVRLFSAHTFFFLSQPKGADVIYVFLSASQSELTFFQPKWADSQKVKRELPAKEAGSPAKMG